MFGKTCEKRTQAALLSLYQAKRRHPDVWISEWPESRGILSSRNNQAKAACVFMRLGKCVSDKTAMQIEWGYLLAILSKRYPCACYSNVTAFGIGYEKVYSP